MKCPFYDGVTYEDSQCVANECSEQRKRKCLEEYYEDDFRDMWNDYELAYELDSRE